MIVHDTLYLAEGKQQQKTSSKLHSVRGEGAQKKDKNSSKGKGRRFCLGGRLYQFLAALAILPKDDFKE